MCTPQFVADPGKGRADGVGVADVCREPLASVDRALELAQSIADAAPLGVQGLLKASRFALEVPREAIAKQIFESLEPIMASEDAAEGVQSFIERRKAVFTGR